MRLIITGFGPRLALCLLAATTLALGAAEDGEAKGPAPVKGIIASASATAVVVAVDGDEGEDPKQLRYELAEDATIRNGKEPLAAADLPVGARVMVKLDAEGRASSIKVMKPKGPKPEGEQPRKERKPEGEDGEAPKPRKERTPKPDEGDDGDGGNLDGGGMDFE